MIKFYKTLSALFFIGAPSSFIAAIWYHDWRFFFIALTLFLFSAFAAGIANSAASDVKKQDNLDKAFTMLDEFLEHEKHAGE